MNFAPPLRGPIHPEGWLRPAGNTDFELTQVFGCTGFPSEAPFGNCAHFHRGNDYGNGRAGDAIGASAAGTVIYSATYINAASPANGSNDIVIEHGGGFQTIYSHMPTRLVSKGQVVAQGHVVGVVGEAGNATDPHLHFGVKSGMPPGGNYFDDSVGTYEDPWPLIQGGDVDVLTELPVAIADFTATPLYVNRDGSPDPGDHLGWQGAKNIGVYAEAAPGSTNPAMPYGPTLIRADNVTGEATGTDLRPYYADASAGSNLRAQANTIPVATPPPVVVPVTPLAPGLYKVGP